MLLEIGSCGLVTTLTVLPMGIDFLGKVVQQGVHRHRDDAGLEALDRFECSAYELAGKTLFVLDLGIDQFHAIIHDRTSILVDFHDIYQ